MSSHRISSKDLSVGVQVERAEHPWASKQVAMRLAEDHLRQDPNAYSDGGGKGGATPVVILNQNVRVRPATKKRKPIQQQQQGGGGPEWLPQNLRIWG
jgi:alpha-L-fucosidase